MSSKYKVKQQHRGKSTPKARIERKPDTPVFLYTSECCRVPAVKPACIRSRADRDAGEYSKANLGTWSCTRCKRKAKVSRNLNKEGISVGSL